eukprot:CAMPEP_0167758252 /NCGR_PEP_ID=MMETSP0110_2-20121227/10367_1 /TAXON_ID=629695 /ORGANISM="Gymnochlora sp., Strain CCMP2014" /LENGTH=576 /DNA_ID=CAMNT_0007644511 /DNA_START=116 /DNA_END=1842 /DNA_ORIENTATION=+
MNAASRRSKKKKAMGSRKPSEAAKKKERKEKSKIQRKKQSNSSNKGKSHDSKGQMEKRIDTSDGGAYTKREFLEFYGKEEGEWLWSVSAKSSQGDKGRKSAKRDKNHHESVAPKDVSQAVAGSGEASQSVSEQKQSTPDTQSGSISENERIENEQSVADEVEALEAILGEGNVDVTRSGVVVIKVEIRLTNEVSGRPPLLLSVTPSPGYPSQRLPEFSIYADWLTSNKKTQAYSELVRIAKEELIGCPVLYSWVGWLQENVKPPPAIQASSSNENLPSKMNNLHLSSSSNIDTPKIESPVVLSRMIIYSHHIIASSKRQAVMEEAVNRDLGGMSKIGWPGVIVVEGRKENVKDYFATLKRLRWQQLTVRGEETVKGLPGQTLNDLRVLPRRKFVEYGEMGMSQIAAACKTAGLGFLFDLYLQKRKGSTSKREKDSKTNSWISGDPFTDRKSTFQAHLVAVKSKSDVEAAMNLLLQNRKIARATHNISAFRFVGTTGGIVKDYDDDGETAAGGRLLHLLDLGKAESVLVVVSRWYGGILLGPDRFRHINNAARVLLEEHNFIKGKGNKKSTDSTGKG